MMETASPGSCAVTDSMCLDLNQATADVKPWPIKWRKVSKWDGQDASPPVEEDLDN